MAERRRAEAEQKRQYQWELSQQIREKEMRRKRELEESREDQREESFFKFGRPGAGAPFRDAQGHIVCTRSKKFVDSDPRFLAPQTYPPPDRPPHTEMRSLPHPLPPSSPPPPDFRPRPTDSELYYRNGIEKSPLRSDFIGEDVRKTRQPVQPDLWSQQETESPQIRVKKAQQVELPRDLQVAGKDRGERQTPLQAYSDLPKFTELSVKPTIIEFPSKPVRPLENELVRLRNEMIRENQELRESLQQVKEQLLQQRPVEAGRSKEQEAMEIELFDAFARDPGKHTYEPIARLAAAHSPAKVQSRVPVLASADKSLVGVSTFLPVPPDAAGSVRADAEMSQLDSLIADYLETEKRMQRPASGKGRASRMASRGQMVLNNAPIRSGGSELDTSVQSRPRRSQL